MTNKTIRTISFLLLTLTTAVSAVYLDSIPNHRVGYGDYDMWLSIEIFPIVFIIHGTLSGIILESPCKCIFSLATLSGFVVSFIFNRIAIDNMDIGKGIISGLILGVVYTVISLIGLIIGKTVKKILVLLLQKISE